MTDDLVKRLREFEISDDLGNGDFSTCEEAADRIEALERWLSIVNKTLNVAITETIPETTAENWREFCEAIIAQTNEILREETDD
tara:strand:- start:404 stop:658 length:255 start_codon:yes stop_codon:yes gene_type:complete